MSQLTKEIEAHSAALHDDLLVAYHAWFNEPWPVKNWAQSVDIHLKNFLVKRKGWEQSADALVFTNGLKIFIDPNQKPNPVITVIEIGKQILRAELEEIVPGSEDKGSIIRQAIDEFEKKDWNIAFVRRKVNEK